MYRQMSIEPIDYLMIGHITRDETPEGPRLGGTSTFSSLMAKALGLKTMLGCMISSSVSVTAAAHLSPLVDYADLDGNLLISNDPYRGVLVKDGKLVLPDGPGLGLTPA